MKISVSEFDIKQFVLYEWPNKLIDFLFTSHLAAVHLSLFGAITLQTNADINYSPACLLNLDWPGKGKNPKAFHCPTKLTQRPEMFILHLLQVKRELPHTVLLVAINFIRDTTYLHQVKLRDKELSRQIQPTPPQVRPTRDHELSGNKYQSLYAFSQSEDTSHHQNK